MFLNFLDDIFLLDFALETAQGVFQRLAFLESYFRQSTHLLTCLDIAVSYSYNKGLIKKVKINLCAFSLFADLRRELIVKPYEERFVRLAGRRSR